MKRFFALALACMMFVGLMAGCSDNASTTSSPDAGTSTDGPKTDAEPTTAPAEEMESIVFTFPATKVVDGIQMVEEEINKIIEPKLKVHVTLEGISMANYSEQVNLMVSSGEQIDLMGFLGNYSTWLSRNQFKPLNELVDTYGQGIREAVGDNMIKATTSDGTIYAVPNNNGKAHVLNIVIREDLLEASDISTDGLKQAKNFEEYLENMDELGNIFAQLKAANPDMVMVVPGGNGVMSFTYPPFIDNLSDYYGVIRAEDADELKVSNLFASEEFATLLDYAHDWFQKGYILQDAATTQEAQSTYLSSDRTTGYFISGEEGQAEQITTQTGKPVVAIKLLEPYINTGVVNSTGFGISATSAHEAAAMKFLNESYVNAEMANLLAWGIEGTHYEVQDDGTIDFPEGVTAENTSYGLNMDWFFGNQFLTYIWGKGRDVTIYERLDANNKHASFSPAMGFSYDSTVVRNELTALGNTFNEYMPGLMTGTLDPATELPKFLEALDRAGIDVVIEEKQRQLDAWAETNT